MRGFIDWDVVCVYGIERGTNYRTLGDPCPDSFLGRVCAIYSDVHVSVGWVALNDPDYLFRSTYGNL